MSQEWVIPAAFAIPIGFAIACRLIGWLLVVALGRKQAKAETRETSRRILCEMYQEDELERMWRLS